MSSNKNRQKKYEKDFLELKTVANRIIDLLFKITDPESLNISTGTIEENVTELIPYMFAYSITVVYSEMYELAIGHQHITTAILSRSTLEVYANIGWIHRVRNNTQGFRKRTKMLFEQLKKVDELAGGKIDYVSPISKLDAGSLQARLKKLGSSWPMIYSHLSSYSHMDTGFIVHYFRGETDGVRNLFVCFSSIAATHCIEMLIDLLPVKEESLKELRKELNELDNTFKKLRIMKSAIK